MPIKRVEFHNIGSVGIMSDISADMLPPEAWSDGANVRFCDNKIERTHGKQTVLGTPTVAPYWALGVPASAQHFILYAGSAAVYVVVGSTEVHTDITRVSGAYNMNDELLWNGGLIGGIPILNNGVDDPQYWPTQTVGTKLADLANWPANYTARVVRPFRQFLVALHVTKTSVVWPHLVLWSHPADPGTVPVSWDVTDPTKDAGETELTDSDSADVIYDGLQLGNQFIIYKGRTAHRMTFIGGTYIFRFDPIKGQNGILSTSCVHEVPADSQKPLGGMHFIATEDDIVLFDGQQQKSLLSKVIRRSVANSLSREFYNRSFVVSVPGRQEMWFCFPEEGATWPTRVVTWNYDCGTLSYKDIADLSFIHSTVIEEPTGLSDIWDDATGVWDTDTEKWDSVTPYSQRQQRLLGCDPVNTKLFRVDDTNQDDGINFVSFVERKGLAVVGKDRQGNPRVDYTNLKQVSRIWIRATGGAFTVRVGAHNTIDETVSWGASQTFTPGLDTVLDLLDTAPIGRMIAVRFESAGDAGWTIESYDMTIILLGEY